MKISISVPGRFWAFSLAKHLNDHGYLHCLVTSYPLFEVKKYGVPVAKVKTIVSKEVIQRLYRKLTGRYPKGAFLNNWFDRIASRKLPTDSDIYVIWAGFGSHSIEYLRKKNPHALFLIERGSTHIEVQNELLKICQKSAQPIDPGIIKKELIEYQLADYIILGGNFSKKSYLDKGIPEKKLFVNNYGVDLSKFNISEKEYQKQTGVFTIGYVGILDDRKNIKGLINAVKMLIEKGYHLKLLLAGQIDINVITTAVLSSMPFIDYRGTLPEYELPRLYREMDIFVLNSVEDGFGMVLLQAMAMEVVPIATYNTGGPDLIKNGFNGFLIPILDDTALADCIEKLIHSPEKEKIGKNAMETVKSGYSWQDYGDRAIEFYKRIFKNEDPL